MKKRPALNHRLAAWWPLLSDPADCDEESRIYRDVILAHAAIGTAFAHCRPGGVALFAPDWTRDRFAPSTSHGVHDRGDWGFRYLEWTIDHDPADDRYSAYLSYVTREGRRIRPTMLPFDHGKLEKGKHVLFVGLRCDLPGGPTGN